MEPGTRHLVLLFFTAVVVATSSTQSQAGIFNISNLCHYTLWPAIIPQVGGGGMRLDPGKSWVVEVPEGTVMGWVWARTGCSSDSPGNLSCQTGDCDGALVCKHLGNPPFNCAVFNLITNPSNTTEASYINVMDGFNVPMAFLAVPEPSKGSGSPGCSKGSHCTADITSQCPDELKVPGGCLGACETCNGSLINNNTLFYARMCPEAKTYGFEVPYFECPLRTNYQIIFCPPANLVSLSPSPSENGTDRNSSTSSANENGTNSSKSKKRRKLGFIIGGSLGGLILVASLVLFLILHKRSLQRRQEMRQEMEQEDEEADFGMLPGLPKRFTFEQLEIATDHFREKIGNGGFGSVFKGRLDNEPIAVKKLEKTGQGKKEFLAEIQTIGTVHHLNVIRIIGFCAEKSQRLLVYEFMPKGSLDKYIFCRHGVDNTPFLDWQTRCKIITHVARGLCYLHEECIKKVAHLDVKPQNILLDDNFDAKLSDFGLSKLIDRDMSQVVTRMRGTPGYLSPEWLTSTITEKADVYSFGVVIMEIVSGRKNLDSSRSENSVHLITMLEEKLKSNDLLDLIDSNVIQARGEAIKMIQLAVWCLQVDWKQRPKMSEVVKVLEGTLSVRTDIDRNLVSMDPFGAPGTAGTSSAPSQARTPGMSAPPPASELSGPR